MKGDAQRETKWKGPMIKETRATVGTINATALKWTGATGMALIWD